MFAARASGWVTGEPLRSVLPLRSLPELVTTRSRTVKATAISLPPDLATVTPFSSLPLPARQRAIVFSLISSSDEALVSRQFASPYHQLIVRPPPSASQPT